MLLPFLAMPRAGDITSPDDIEDSYVWREEITPEITWTEEENFAE